jgi:pentatricopeptide repeat protein
MTLSSHHPRHDHVATAAAPLCHLEKYYRTISSSTISTASSISTPIVSSSSAKNYVNMYPFQINEAAQKGESTLAERLLLEMHQEYNRTQNVAFHPRRSVFGMVLNAWAKSGLQEAPQRAESILRRMFQLHEQHQLDTKPDVICYSSVMNCWAQSEQREAADKSMALLREMQSLWKQGHSTMRPNVICYTTVLSAYTKRGQAAEAEALLEEMYLDYTTSGNESAKPTTTSYNIVMNCWAKSGEPNAAGKSLAMLLKMQSLWKQGYSTVRPDAISYNTVMSAYAKQGQAAEAEALLEEMYVDYSTNGNGKAKPTVISYSAVMNCWAKSGRPEAAEKSLALLRRMQSLWKQGHATVRPNVICYNTVMSAYAKQGRAAEAEALLEEMYVDYSINGNESAKPTMISFTVVLDAWSKSKSRHAPERAETILMRMIELHQAGKLDAKPTRVSYNCVIYAWANSAQTNAAEQAEAVFRHMQQRWKAGGDQDVKPDIVVYGTILHAYAKRGQAEKAQALLDEMHHDSNQVHDGGNNNEAVRPVTRSYNAVLDAWAKSKLPYAPQRAESMLATMWELYESSSCASHPKDNNVKPDVFTYTSVIQCWARFQDGPEQAERLLAEMKTRSRSSGDGALQPNHVTYNSVMMIWYKSKRGTQAVQRVVELLQEMLSLAAQGNSTAAPSVMTFNVVLRTISSNTTATVEEKRRDALTILRLMNENHIAPDKWTMDIMEHLKLVDKGQPKYMKKKNIK